LYKDNKKLKHVNEIQDRIINNLQKNK
jgi:hypothetical protein